MNRLLTTLLFLILFCLTTQFVGCGQTIYDRETLTIDPNGVATYERVHIGSTGVATAKTIDGMTIETGRGSIVLSGATADNDSVKATTPYGIIETKKGQKDEI